MYKHIDTIIELKNLFHCQTYITNKYKKGKTETIIITQGDRGRGRGSYHQQSMIKTQHSFCELRGNYSNSSNPGMETIQLTDSTFPFSESQAYEKKKNCLRGKKIEPLPEK